jgi:tetratricopeptide (TPR) repeat protein
VPHAATVRALPDASRARFLRAELEFEVGDLEVARNYYEGFDHSWSFWDTYYRPLAYRRLGEIAERQGRYADAIVWYERLLDTWKHCDPELVTLRDEIEARRAGLLARRSQEKARR